MSRQRTRANGEGSIFPYRNGYAAYVWVTTPSGLRDRKYVYGKTREVVHEKWVALQGQAARGPVPTRTPTVGEYLRYWLAEIVAPNLAPPTASTYETLCRLYIEPGIGTKRLDRLQVRDVQRWLNHVRDICQCCTQGKDARRREDRRRCCATGKCCRQVPSTRTIRDLRAVLRAALSHAQSEELVTRNVAALVRLPEVRSEPGRAWTVDEVRTFLESARRDHDSLYAGFVLIVALGLRKGEVLGLSWTDLDPDAGELHIRKQLQRVGGRLLHRETKTKTSAAVLPLPDTCLTALDLRKIEQEKDQAEAGPMWHDTGLIFTTCFGTPIEPRNFNRAFTARCRRARVPSITVHDARRTCASLLVELDIHPRTVMQILRHARFTITMEIYSRVSSQATREALKKLGDRPAGTVHLTVFPAPTR